jgi:peptidoglycan/xylan/chitin deacetylase (PgdA/CDA1 family)
VTDAVLEQRASRWGRPLLLLTAVATATAAVLTATGLLPMLVALLCGLALLAVISCGVVLQSSGVFARPLLSVQTTEPQLALTFDDGPDPTQTRRILDLLETKGHRATFFVIGHRAAPHAELLREIAARGHAVENHSWHHSYVTNLVPPRKLAEELRRASAMIEQATGRAPRWLRPPVGLLSPRVAEAATTAGLDLVAWTASGRDGVAHRTVEDAVARLDPYLRPGSILVLHDAPLAGTRKVIAPEVLAQLLARMEARGLRSVTLDVLVAGRSG